jgi:hypothetical protein
MLKRVAVIALAVSFLSLAVAPESFACDRNRRSGSYRGTSARYYGPVASRYYSPSRTYSPYRGVASDRYYADSDYRGYRNHSTRNAILTVAGPAAIAAGVGAIAGGGKGAGIGALIGGGGGAVYYLLRHRGRR